MAAQILLFWKAYEGSSKKEADTNFALHFVFFSPIALLGGFTNLHSFAELLWYLIILAPLTDTILNDRLILSLLSVGLAYFNPGCVISLLPLLVVQARLKVPEEQGSHDPFKRLMLLVGLGNMVWMFGLSSSQKDNVVNILMVNNKQETMGNYWYLMVMMFSDRVRFFKKLYLVLQLLCCAFISMLLH